MNAYSNYNRTANNPLPNGFWKSAGGAYTQNVTPDQLTSTQLNDLTAGNSQYIQQARDSAAADAAARGISGSSYAAGNAQRAAISAALPIAQANSNVLSQAALSNQTALNNVGMNNANNMTSMHNANVSAAASRYGSDQSRIASEYGQNAETQRQREQNQFNSQFQPYLMGLQNQYGAQDWARNTYGNILQGAYATMFSSPDYFNNPDAALGFINGFGNFASNQVNQYLYG